MITVVVMLGLLKAVEIATEQGMRNQVRDEMTQVADARMHSFRAMPFDQISTCSSSPGNSTCPDNYTYAPESIASRVRGINRSYIVTRSTIVSSGNTALDLGVRVRSWAYKNMSTSWEMHTVKVQ